MLHVFLSLFLSTFPTALLMFLDICLWVFIQVWSCLIWFIDLFPLWFFYNSVSFLYFCSSCIFLVSVIPFYVIICVNIVLSQSCEGRRIGTCFLKLEDLLLIPSYPLVVSLNFLVDSPSLLCLSNSEFFLDTAVELTYKSVVSFGLLWILLIPSPDKTAEQVGFLK